MGSLNVNFHQTTDAYVVFDLPSPENDVYAEMTGTMDGASLAAIWTEYGDPGSLLLRIEDPSSVGCREELWLHDEGFTGSYNSIKDFAYGSFTAIGPTPSVAFTLKVFIRNLTSVGQYFSFDADTQVIDNSGCGPWSQVWFGLRSPNGNPVPGAGANYAVTAMKVGTTDGGSDLLDWQAANESNLSDFTVVGDVTLTPAPTPPATTRPGARLWEFVVLDAATFETLSFLQQFMTSRAVTYTLNQPAVGVGNVPSDNPEVNIPWPGVDDDPFLSEGTRVLYGFRREGTLANPPIWVPRFAGLIMQLEDVAQSDDAQTAITAYDPWQYLMSRPVCNADGSLPGPNGLSFTATRADVIAGELLDNTIQNQGDVYIDAGIVYGGTGDYTGTIEPCEAIDINFAQGTSVGQAWQTLAQMNVCDIILEPIYDPINRPRYLAQFNIYAQAGQPRDNAIFAWDRPSRSLVGVSRLIEGGTQRANKVKYFAGQGGSAPGGQTVAMQTDAASVIKFGEYWRQQFFPSQTVAAVVLALAQEQLQLSSAGRVTVAISPAPERSPDPFEDYFLGDRVPVYASERFRAPIPAPDVPSSDTQNYQRVYGIPVVIGDDSVERVQQLLTAIPA